ncbi:MurR/RpiR family transcriptional regulator [Pararhizobium sp. IMCC21322]|uniref:MurR/RpiR family transcriptional regulator n=1 Tax=Pararhizobium sp. IMCC21322 TaxID=3067903 RepID=UPI002740F04B|nr:MurR/RpiR family transcriptional regulator [Pararhizobium sp. IMCC21322]
MTKVRRVLEMIRARLETFGASERRVAELLLATPDAFAGVGLAKLSESAGVSQPTVIRFSRKLGFDGYSDFKVSFAQSIALEPLAAHQDIDQTDAPSDIIHKLSQSAIQAITGARDGLDPDQVGRAGKVMAKARRVEFIANGAAYSVAVEGHNKLYRLGLPCSIISDSFTQTVMANILGAGDVMVVISFSGTAAMHLSAVKMARAAGATVIAFTRPGSPLAKIADVTVGVSVREDFEAFTPLSTPLAFMLALDAVVVCAAPHRPEGTAERHQMGKLALARIRDNAS